MAALSGKKYPIYKARDLPPENFNHENAESGANSVGNSRSVGKKYLPVRISTAFFEDQSGSRNPGSTRKTPGLSSRKPIRNIHKLLESPKRTVRKRLDNLFDYSKPKENTNSTTLKAQALSAKKAAPKTPVLAATSGKKLGRKTELINHGQNPRRSRLLPPGTITGTYVNGRNSLAPRTSISKPSNNRFTLTQKIHQSKRPSDVPEESPQLLESSYDASDEAKKTPLIDCTAKKSMECSKGADTNSLIDIRKETSEPSDSLDENERLVYCCKCSQMISGPDPSKNGDKLAGTSIKIRINSEEIVDDGSTSDKNKTEVVFERPTVIVMQKEAGLRINGDNNDGLLQVPVQDGSYSEILSLQPSADSSRVDETLLFKLTESACTRSEKEKELNSGDKTGEFIFELISTSHKMLVEQKTYLTDSISQCESNLKTMKLMLKNVDAQLDKQKTLESSIKSNGLSNFTSEESSLHSKKNSSTILAAQAEGIDDSETSLKEDLEIGQETNSAKETKRRKSRKSLRAESGGEIQEGNDSSENVLREFKQEDNEKTENIENEPPQRRRSARLASKNGDLSLPIEQSTPAAGKKMPKVTQAKSKPCTPSMTTPARSAKWGRRSERPLREYMVLKSAMKFLNTPDSRRYRIGSDEKVKIRDSLDKTDQALLSDKLLKELHDLYATP